MYATAEELRLATRAAGLRIFPHRANGERVVQLGNADRQAVLSLAKVIEYSVAGVYNRQGATQPRQRPAPSEPAALSTRSGTHNEPGTDDMHSATSWLLSAARKAGLDLHPGEPTTTPDGERLPLGPVDRHTATALTGFIKNSITSHFEDMAQLDLALDEHGIDLPALVVHEGQVRLGKLSVPAADKLLNLIDPTRHLAATDEDDWEAGLHLAQQLTDAVKAATEGGFLSAQYRPPCLSCSADATIALGSLHPAAVRLLTARLGKAG